MPLLLICLEIPLLELTFVGCDFIVLSIDTHFLPVLCQRMNPVWSLFSFTDAHFIQDI